MVEFNRKLWQKSRRRARKWKAFIIIITLFSAIVIFGFRDNWFTDAAIFCWQDYVLYLLLTMGSSCASAIKNFILFKSSCFTSPVSSDNSKQSVSDLLVAMNATIEGIIKVLKEKD